MATPDKEQARTFREVVQRRLMKDVVEAAAELTRGWMVMVIDDAALRVVSALVGMYDVMEHRVTLIELLSKKRQPLPEMEVIYLVTPSAETVDGILKDFSDPKKPMYGNVHLFFLSKVGDTLMRKLGTNQALLARVRTFKEVNMNFLATETSAFHLDMPNCIPRLFTTRPDNSVMEEIAYKLVSLCVTLNEYPHVRYNTHSVIATQIATMVQDSLNDFVGRTEEWWYYGQAGHTEKDRGTLLILDRAEDPLTPFMHDHNYQAIVQDLLEVKDDMITFSAESKGGKPDSKALLNDADNLWTEFRHQHIAKVMETISDRTREFIQANAGVELTRKMGGGAKMTPAELAQIVRQIPEYREMTGKLFLHYNITSDVMSRFQLYGILGISELEQTMATGVDEEGKAANDAKILQSMETLLGGLESTGMTLNAKIRLLSIYIITQNGITDEVRRQLVAAGGLSQVEQEALVHLQSFGVNLQKSRDQRPVSSSFWGKKKETKKVGRVDEQAVYAASRYVCGLKDLLEQLVEDKLSVEKYPSVMPMPIKDDNKPAARSMRKNNPNSRWGRQEKQAFTGCRSMVFMVGGVTFTEMRAAYEVMSEHEKEVVIGGTSYLTPHEFVEALKAIR